MDQLEYRLESIVQLLQTNPTSYDQQLSDAAKNLLSFELVTTNCYFSPIESMFHKISLAYESGKTKFIEKHPLFSWYDGHCRWTEHQQDMTERKNHDILFYQHQKKNWTLIIVCAVHFDDNGDRFTLTVGSDLNGVYVELPLARYKSRHLDNLDIELQFEREIVNLLQLISIPKHC